MTGDPHLQGRLEDTEVAALLDDYEAELLQQGIVLDRGGPGGVDPDELVAPNGTLLVAELDCIAAGCGGVRRLDEPGIAEVKHMYVSLFARRQGIGAALLNRLEDEARTLGCHLCRLGTGPGMEAALALPRAAGYYEIGDYNGNPHAAYWMEKNL